MIVTWMILWDKTCNSTLSNNLIEGSSRTRMTGMVTTMKLISWTMMIVGEIEETRAMACLKVLSIKMLNNHTSQLLTSSSSCRCSKVQPIVMEAVVVHQDKSTLEAHLRNITTKVADNRTWREGYGIHSVEQLKVVAIEKIISRGQSWNLRVREVIPYSKVVTRQGQTLWATITIKSAVITTSSIKGVNNNKCSKQIKTNTSRCNRSNNMSKLLSQQAQTQLTTTLAKTTITSSTALVKPAAHPTRNTTQTWLSHSTLERVMVKYSWSMTKILNRIRWSHALTFQHYTKKNVVAQFKWFKPCQISSIKI